MIAQLDFKISPKQKFISRQVYTYWDLLGDVGGFFGSLVGIGSFLIWIVGQFTTLSNGLELSIVRDLFRWPKRSTGDVDQRDESSNQSENDSKDSQSDSKSFLSHLLNRKKFTTDP